MVPDDGADVPGSRVTEPFPESDVAADGRASMPAPPDSFCMWAAISAPFAASAAVGGVRVMWRPAMSSPVAFAGARSASVSSPERILSRSVPSFQAAVRRAEMAAEAAEAATA